MLKRQNGRCAISGEKLSPVNVSVDHIFPLSRKEFENEKLYGKSWLVTSKINRLKGSLTLDELYKLLEKIKKDKKLLANILSNFVKICEMHTSMSQGRYKWSCHAI